MRQTFLLVDAFSLIYRAFFAIPTTLTAPDGHPVNAIYGFTKMLRKLRADCNPTHMAVAFDLGPPVRRLKHLPTYKAHRPPTPPLLEEQLPGIHEMLGALRVAIVEIEEEEADDIIATLATQVARAGGRALIASSDKDFFQLVGPQIQMIRPDGKQAMLLDADAVVARHGVKPEQIADYLSLIGDSVDNIPGIPGIGPKTASEMLTTFQSLDNLLARTGEISKPKLRETIATHAGQIRANRVLITLHTDLNLPVSLDSLHAQSPDVAMLTALCRKYGFKSLLAELQAPCERTGDLFAVT
ncbi:MAG: 5'-3' exonuclease H3TH domain-containing protein [Verrucomicrobiia bacterium]